MSRRRAGAGDHATPEERLARLGKVFAHPLRVRILTLMEGEGELSPSRLAERLGEPLGNVSYHVNTLLELGALEARGATPRRGALEHHYTVAAELRGVTAKALRLAP